MERSPAEVLEDHVRLRAEGGLETDLARNYSPDIVLLCEYGALRGHDAMRKSVADLSHQLPDARFDYRMRVPEGAESHVIRNGRTVMRSISYRLVPATPATGP